MKEKIDLSYVKKLLYDFENLRYKAKKAKESEVYMIMILSELWHSQEEIQDIIAFIDIDITVDEEWIKEMVLSDIALSKTNTELREDKFTNSGSIRYNGSNGRITWLK